MRVGELCTYLDADPAVASNRIAFYRRRGLIRSEARGSGYNVSLESRDIEVVAVHDMLVREGHTAKAGSVGHNAMRIIEYVADEGWPEAPTMLFDHAGVQTWLIGRPTWIGDVIEQMAEELISA